MIVELHAAFLWTCLCGHEQFERGHILTPEEARAAVAEYEEAAVAEYAGTIEAPDRVKCLVCGREFETEGA